MTIKIQALIPSDNPLDEYPIAVSQLIEVESWGEWQNWIDLHGIVRWEVVQWGEEPMTPGVLKSYEESEYIKFIDRLLGM